jgi:hypothetical protein
MINKAFNFKPPSQWVSVVIIIKMITREVLQFLMRNKGLRITSSGPQPGGCVWELPTQDSGPHHRLVELQIPQLGWVF